MLIKNETAPDSRVRLVNTLAGYSRTFMSVRGV
jgi:hypothetical protein